MDFAAALRDLGRLVDRDDRCDLYEAVFEHMRAGHDLCGQEGETEVAGLCRQAIDRIRLDLRQTAHSTAASHAVRFLSFVLSTEVLANGLPDRTVKHLFQDVVFVLAESDLVTCAQAIVVIAHEIVSITRPHLVASACCAVLPAIVDAITVRWPASDPLTLEASNAFAHLAEVIPDALHAQRSVWAIPLLKLAFDADNKSAIASNALAALQCIRPTTDRIMFQKTIEMLLDDNRRRLVWVSTCSRDKSIEPAQVVSVVRLWAVIVKLLSFRVFRSKQLWNEIVGVWKNCLRLSETSATIACLDSWQILFHIVLLRPRDLLIPPIVKMLLQPICYILQPFPEGRSAPHVAVCLKAVELWCQLLQHLRGALNVGETISAIYCPVIRLMCKSNHPAIAVQAFNVLASIMSQSCELPESQISDSQVFSQIGYDLEKSSWISEGYSFVLKLFKAVLRRTVTDSEAEAFGRAWCAYLSAVSQRCPERASDSVRSIVVAALRWPHCDSLRGLIVEGVLRHIPGDLMLGDPNTSIAGFIAGSYLTAICVNDSEDRYPGLLRDWKVFLDKVSTSLGLCMFIARQSPAAVSDGSLCAHLYAARHALKIASSELRAELLTLVAELLKKGFDLLACRGQRSATRLSKEVTSCCSVLGRAIRHGDIDESNLPLWDPVIVHLLHAGEPLRSLGKQLWTDVCGDTLRPFTSPALALALTREFGPPPSPVLGGLSRSTRVSEDFQAWVRDCEEILSRGQTVACRMKAVGQESAFADHVRSTIRALTQLIDSDQR
ncbi:hypothetical protein PBRA_000934 [Plasmodiophora brassicae]|uniref:Telomere-associated protein Rif1 N-terminal domain-containing protein n=1 Tax=Plasmodiophora brassicae TaxID=37360 RepID=A0A0G4IQY5_PLABS|nr:hypothetical protein PBRA_000934 [Plasmodiophora brassicae]